MNTTGAAGLPAITAEMSRLYGGEWIAWDEGRTAVVAHGSDLLAVMDAARAAGHAAPLLQKVRKPGLSYIGGA